MDTKTEMGAMDSNRAGGHLLHDVLFSVFTLALVFINFRLYFPFANWQQLPLRHFIALFTVFLFFLTLFAVRRILLLISDRAVAVISMLMFALLVAMEVFCVSVFKVKPTWDFGDIITAAKQISMGKAISYTTYFEIYPHNLKPAVLIGTFMRLFNGAEWSFYMLNVLAISSSVFLAYLIVKKTHGIRNAALVMLLCLLSTPLYLYAPIVYTDTLCLPFPVISIYLWLKWRDAADRKDVKKQILHFFLIAVFSAFGYILKPIAAIVLFAALGEQLASLIFVRAKPKPYGKIALSLISSIVAFLLILGTFYTYADLKGYTKNISEDKAYPYMHWIMMGMNKPYQEGGTSYGYGGFSGEDYNYTKKFINKEARKAADLDKIKERLDDFGFKGYVTFLMNKFDWTWTDPTFYAPVKLSRKPIHGNDFFHLLVLPGSGANTPYLAMGQMVHSLVMAMILFMTVNALFSRKMEGLRAIMVLSSLGIMLFLLVWETRSRYLTYFIPILNIMAVDGLDSAFKKVDHLFSLY